MEDFISDLLDIIRAVFTLAFVGLAGYYYSQVKNRLSVLFIVIVLMIAAREVIAHLVYFSDGVMILAHLMDIVLSLLLMFSFYRLYVISK
jgi:hypothetical protein